MEKKTRLMIVEDEVEEQNAFVEYLKGQEEIDLVGVTGSAAEALKWKDRYRPDVVILDLELSEGEGSGLDLAPALAAPERPHNPYVMVTTKVTDKSTQAYLRNYVGFIYEKRLQNYDPSRSSAQSSGWAAFCAASGCGGAAVCRPCPPRGRRSPWRSGCSTRFFASWSAWGCAAG